MPGSGAPAPLVSGPAASVSVIVGKIRLVAYIHALLSAGLLSCAPIHGNVAPDVGVTLSYIEFSERLVSPDNCKSSN
jgi:hypothetical protein